MVDQSKRRGLLNFRREVNRKEIEESTGLYMDAEPGNPNVVHFYDSVC
jgi:hypothetical protein